MSFKFVFFFFFNFSGGFSTARFVGTVVVAQTGGSASVVRAPDRVVQHATARFVVGLRIRSPRAAAAAATAPPAPSAPSPSRYRIVQQRILRTAAAGQRQRRRLVRRFRQQRRQTRTTGHATAAAAAALRPRWVHTIHTYISFKIVCYYKLLP